MKTYKTNYSVAVNWCNNALILCNNITEIDPSVYDICALNCSMKMTAHKEIFISGLLQIAPMTM